MSAVRHVLMRHLAEAVAEQYPHDLLRQAGTLQHLESLIRDLACLPERQVRALLCGLAEAISVTSTS